jgi:alanyl-tRNA synthetase
MGAMALFGEKYGDEVRVVRFGSSVELCGGTHVANTGNIGMIRIISESSIAAGIRRIEAITGSKVEDMMNEMDGTVKQIRSLFNNAANIIQTIEKSLNESSELRQQVDMFTKERTLTVKENLVKNATIENDIKIIAYTGPMLPEVAKDIAFMLRGEITERMAFIAATYKEGENKPLLTVMLSDDLVAAGKNASQIVRESARLIQGGGGGQPYFAQAGGKDASKLKDALDKMHEMVVA